MDTKKKFNENVEIVRAANASLFEVELKDAAEELQTEYPDHFPRLAHQVDILFKSMDDVNYAYEAIDQLPLVLCHGNLSAANLLFDPNSGKLETIDGWDVRERENLIGSITLCNYCRVSTLAT